LFRTGGYPDVTAYPNVTAYTWNAVSGNYSYNAGSSGLTTSGSSTEPGDKYKWIAFKLNKISATEYSFNGNTYDVESSNGTNYLSIVDMLVNTGLFGSSTISDLFNSSSTDVIGFCRVTNNNSTTNNNDDDFYVYGNFKKGLNAQGIWVQAGSMPSGGGGYSSIDDPQYGCVVVNGLDKGIYIDTSLMNDDLHVFIGLKL